MVSRKVQKQIKGLFKQGYSCRAMARMIDCDRNTIMKIVRILKAE
jgi:transposase-like protein